MDKPLKGFDWAPVKEMMELVLGKGSIIVDYDKKGAVVVEGHKVLAIVSKTGPDSLSVSLRASLTPNTAALIAANLSKVYHTKLESVFEFDKDNELLDGEAATRYFVDNAAFLVYGEVRPSKDAVVVRPKGASLKHRIN